MPKRIFSAFLAIAAAGAAMASAGLAAAAPAAASSAAPRPAVIKTVIDTDFAGYVTGGTWRFRYVAATVPVAKCRSQASQNAAAGIALKASKLTEVAHLDLFCGGGRGSVRFGTKIDANGRFRLSPHIGNVLRISVFRNQAACLDQFVATNTSTGNREAITVRTPCSVIYRHAQLGATFVNSAGVFTPPARNVRLWEIRNLAITSYNGTHGTPCGPWPAEKHLAAPVIAVRMVPSALSNSCRDFGVLLKGRG